jgi:hypothetical protein
MATIADQSTPRTAKALSEAELQDKITASLPENFQFPLFNGRRALESQRKSGYKNSARAAREIVDNAIEAGAENVWIVFRRPDERTRNKSERRDAVTAIAFIDDGPGMSPTMARYALSWGGGTRFETPKGIGRFGFGLPNSSINQTRRVEVYTRRSATDPWAMVALDITPEHLHEIPSTGLVSVNSPVQKDLPPFVADHMKQNKIELGSGTVVVWDRPDRLSVRSAAALRELMLDDFGVTYRYLLERVRLFVDGKAVERADPLFLMANARFHLPPDQGGAECKFDIKIPVKYWRDPETGEQHLEPISSAGDLRKARQSEDGESTGVIGVKIARFPYGFAAERVRQDGQTVVVPKDDDRYKRLQIRKKRRGISYVRAQREVDYVDHLPTTDADKANGLGDWPVLQAYSMHWALEVTFPPSLDEAFGIGNDKQTVSPIEDVWRVLAAKEVDVAVQREQQHQHRMREDIQKEEGKRQAEDISNAGPVSDAAGAADEVMGGAGTLPEGRAEEARKKHEDEVRKRALQTGQSRDEVEDALEEEAKRKKYGIEFFDAPGGVFFEPDFGNGLQRIARVNKAHPFFKFFYGELINLPNARPRQAVDLLLLALARSELKARDQVKTVLQYQRESEWSPFLKLGLDIIDQIETRDYDGEEEAPSGKESEKNNSPAEKPLHS